MKIVRVFKYFYFIALLCLPWKIRRLIFVNLFGYMLDPNARIGLSWVFPKKLIMHRGAKIAHFNFFKPVDLVEIGEFSSIGSLNWITGFPYDSSFQHFSNELDRRNQLIIGQHSHITSRHLIDCTNSVKIGDFSTIAGYRSQILTHSIDLEKSAQTTAPVKIGDYVFIGSQSILLKGTSIPNYAVIGAGSLVNKSFSEEFTLYAGVPARKIKIIPSNWRYFKRKEGMVI